MGETSAAPASLQRAKAGDFCHLGPPAGPAPAGLSHPSPGNWTLTAGHACPSWHRRGWGPWWPATLPGPGVTTWKLFPWASRWHWSRAAGIGHRPGRGTRPEAETLEAHPPTHPVPRASEVLATYYCAFAVTKAPAGGHPLHTPSPPRSRWRPRPPRWGSASLDPARRAQVGPLVPSS